MGTTVTGVQIKDGSVTNADISPSAAIDISKINTTNVALLNGVNSFSQLQTFANGFAVTGGSFAAGQVYRSSFIGFGIGARAGSTHDFAVYDPAGATAIIAVPTGGTKVRLGGDLEVTGKIGWVGIAQTAQLHLKPGSASANLAALKFTSGSTLAVAEAGAIEYTGPYYYFTTSTLARRTFASTEYIQSRGLNLVTNGSGLMGDNTNFSQMTFDQVETYGGRGSFKWSATGGTFTSDELIPVDGSRSYKLSVWAKATVYNAANVYIGVICIDIDGLGISPYFIMRRTGSDTTLAAPLKPGHTTMTLTSSAGWLNGTAPYYSRSALFFGWKNSFGYLYPNYTYSRYWSGQGAGQYAAATASSSAVEPTWGVTVTDQAVTDNANLTWVDFGAATGSETAWAANTVYTDNVGVYRPTVANGRRYRPHTGGLWKPGQIVGNVITLSSAWPVPSTGNLFSLRRQTGAVQPTWNTGAGSITDDNNIEWTEFGAPVGGETVWSAGATITLNSFIVPTVGNGHRYKATMVEVLPAGTAVSNGDSGGNYKYIAASNVLMPATWTNYTGVIGGWDVNGTNTTNTGGFSPFPYGTAYIKLMALPNYNNVAGSTQNFSMWTLTDESTQHEIYQPTQTGATVIPAVKVSTTWNNAAVSYKAMQFQIFDTASASASTVIDIYTGTTGGTRVAYIDKSGNIWAAGSLICGVAGAGIAIISGGTGIVRLSNSAGTDLDRVQLGGSSNSFPALKRSGNAVQVRSADDAGYTNIVSNAWLSGSNGGMMGNANGVIQLRNNNNDDFGRLQFGGTSTSFPAIKRSATALHFRLADDSAYTFARASSWQMNSGSFIMDNADGVVQLSNAAVSDFARLQFGGTTSAFPALKRSSTQIHVRLADDSNYTNIRALAFITSGGSNITSGTDGLLTMFNASQNDFNRLNFGGTTNAFPALKRNGNRIDIRLADDSAAANLACGTLFVNSGTNGSVIHSSNDGIMQLYNTALTDFSRLNLGGTTNAFPSIKRNGTAINFRLADDSADCDITAGQATFATVIASTFTGLPATAFTDITGKPTTMAGYGITDGTWVTPSYSAGDFTASGSMTWTVEAGDIWTYAYTKIRNTITVAWYLASTTVGGTADGVLWLKIPAGLTAQRYTLVPLLYNEGGGNTYGFAQVSAGATWIGLYKNSGNWALGSAQAFFGSITFEVA